MRQIVTKVPNNGSLSFTVPSVAEIRGFLPIGARSYQLSIRQPGAGFTAVGGVAVSGRYR